MSAQKFTPLGIVVALLIGVIVMSGIAEIGMRIFFPHWSEFYSGRFMKVITVPEGSRVLIGKPGFDGYFAQNNGDFRVHVNINAFGLRDPKPLEAANDAVWVVGDSMAFGWGVEVGETYSSVIAANGVVQTYNIASPGTDVCGYQALTARMPRKLKPKAVIVGLILENDIHDYDCRKRAGEQAFVKEKPQSEWVSFAYLKEWLTRYSALYNAVAVSLKRVQPIVRVLSAVGLINREHVYKVSFGDKNIEKFVAETASEIARLRDMFASTVPFAVLIAPARFEIRDNDRFYRKLREQMVGALSGRNIPAIDPADTFKSSGFKPTHFAHDGHWSPLGHEIAGKAVIAWLRQQAVVR